jgi:zinc protease
VGKGLASSITGSLLPTQLPFVYIISATATDGTPLAAVERELVDELAKVAKNGITPAELAKAKSQLNARLVFENDSVTNIAHQIGYFETVAGPDYFGAMQSRIEAVTAEQVWQVATRRLAPATRTTGWFLPIGAR